MEKLVNELRDINKSLKEKLRKIQELTRPLKRKYYRDAKSSL